MKFRRSKDASQTDALRSLLFVPLDDPRKLAKVKTLRPDAFILDLEDSVSPDRKVAARTALTEYLGHNLNYESKIFVRVNSSSTTFFDADLHAAIALTLDGIVLPKCEDPEQLKRIEHRLTRLEAKTSITRGSIRLLPIVETARGIIHAYEIARSSERIVALLFGPEDYCADMGIKRTASGNELSMARMQLSQAAHAAQVAAIDGVFSDFGDTGGLIEDANRGKQMGYTGKTLIHPDQIQPVHRVFAPSEDELTWAQEVVQTFEAANGSGVVVVRGRMVDEPVVRQARRILSRRDIATRQIANADSGAVS